MFHGLVLVLISISIMFVLVRLVPGDPAAMMLPAYASASDVAELHAALGLDQPLVVQYQRFFEHLLHGDLGRSFTEQRPALSVVLRAAPVTLALLGASFALGVAFALPVGILSALRPGSAFDRISLPIVLLGQSMPTYWIGLLLISLFAVALRWLPTSGYGGLKYYILPSFSLAMWIIASLTRVTRVRVQEILREPFLRVALAKGLARSTIVRKHVLRLALVEIVTAIGLELGYLFGGAVVTEAIYALPGLGSVALQSILNRDYPVVQGIVLYIAVMIVLLNLLLDFLYVYLDPRIQI